jgi:hypothetical protein
MSNQRSRDIANEGSATTGERRPDLPFGCIIIAFDTYLTATLRVWILSADVP